jgi:dolichyl-diphosphooligosaccharide--protein glycosyltransferase
VRFKNLVKTLYITTAIGVVLFVLYVSISGKMKWSGRSLSLLDPTYAKKYIPIIASVSEHQPTTWASYFFDLHYLLVFSPVGFYYCFSDPTPGKIFLGIFGVLGIYFSSVMVRLLLVAAPALSAISGLGLSQILYNFTRHIRYYREWRDYVDYVEEPIPELVPDEEAEEEGEEKKKEEAKEPEQVVAEPPQKPQWGYPLETAICVIITVAVSVMIYVSHCSWVGAEAYSSPTIVIAQKDYQGGKKIVDDFREAYYWLRMNTPEDAKIMSWWDYGYQITGMSNRTVLVDNNTWNNTHIATMGMIFGSNEEDAAKHLRRLDVDYVLVIFGGQAYYSGDDINKFIWMLRIASGVYPNIKEDDFLSKGRYRIDSEATETMRDSLMYKLSYYRFGE